MADLLQGGLWALQEHALQVASHSVLNTRPLSLPGLHEGLCLAYLGRWGDDKEGSGRASLEPAEQQHHEVNDSRASCSGALTGTRATRKILEGWV